MWAGNSQGQIVVLHNEKNEGFGPANNQGARIARGSILLFINNDIIIRGDYLTPIITALTQHPDDLVGAELLDFDTGWNKFGDKIIHYLHGWCLAMKKATFRTLGGFDERYIPADFEDIDLCYTATGQDRKLHPIKLPVGHMSGQTARQLKDRMAMTTKHQKLFAEKWGLDG